MASLRTPTTAPPIDPTANVKALFEAGMKRQDDLRELSNQHIKEMSNLRAEHSKEMSASESARLDSIRQVDQLHQLAELKTQREAILTLERTTLVSAETLRSQNSSAMMTHESRLAALERQMYENTGKEKVSDPIYEKLIATIESLKDSRSVDMGRSGGMSQLWALIGGGVMLLLGLAAFFSRILGS